MADTQDRILRPSGSGRWTKCVGSVAMCAGYPRTDSAAAASGRVCHSVADWCFKKNKNAVAFPLKVVHDEDSGKDIPFTDDMRETVAEYVTVVRELAEGNTISSEMQLEDMAAGMSGTIDASVFLPKKREIHVHDLKSGRRPVHAQENPQLAIYGDALVRLAETLFGPEQFNTVRLFIHQPHLGIADEWVLSLEELRMHVDEIEIRGEEALALVGAAKDDIYGCLTPGLSQCQYCDAKAECPALEGFTRQTIVDDFEDVSRPVMPEKVEAATQRVQSQAGSDNAHIASLLPHIALVRLWCDAVEERAESELSQGNSVPGYKLVEGRKGTRKWIDEQSAIQKLKNQHIKRGEIFQEKLLTPAQAEKLIGKEKYARLLAQYVAQSTCKPQVVPEADKRPAISLAADEFTNLDESEME